ncbi:PEP-CTERM sorting domain-containing protein [Alterisphingorhabdus coralli]|uniref:PEP-CTERM sorting domain-containing protein n=1 Tax=Alterisphingorhabdus coralli TaxID=3071408 RepID=A0AA97HZA8_9SPHN|nr:PEP-CTERM sorting domain-containing protein [Parasphingorhabdus sp. SCSIO 66989]WOE74419.1 PEP-CTERM sorting domain-containing protein [Parasphingorhabdus sp. SCSIO 66989]
MIKTIIKGAMAVAALLAVPQMASANVIEFDAKDANNKGSCSHGLWTGNYNSGCSRHYSMQDGSLFTVDEHNQTATFTGSAINNKGAVAQIDLSFGGFLETIDGTNFIYKAGGGPYNPGTDTPDIDFFTTGSGTITIDGRVFTLNPNDPFAGNTAVQIGPGANDKNKNFGASAWLNILDPYGHPLSKHWDFNLNLHERPGTPVPAPAGLGLMALGLAGLGVALRRRRREYRQN